MTVSPATTPVQPVFYLYIEDPFIPFGIPRARKVCLSSTPPSQIESSFLPMIDNVRGTKQLFVSIAVCTSEKTGGFFFSLFLRAVNPWASGVTLVPDVAASPVKSSVRRAQAPPAPLYTCNVYAVHALLRLSTDISPRGIFRRHVARLFILRLKSGLRIPAGWGSLDVHLCSFTVSVRNHQHSRSLHVLGCQQVGSLLHRNLSCLSSLTLVLSISQKFVVHGDL